MTPSQKIDQLIASIKDWRAEIFARMRKCILSADKNIVEEWKWMGSPVWECDGILAVGNFHEGKVKLTFDFGAKLPDPQKLFNAGLEGNQRRAIDFLEGDRVNEAALKKLVKAAIAFNKEKRAGKKGAVKKPAAKKRAKHSSG
ncbi:MAG: DUF1801 domain-containing protein [Rhizobiales bacterium]|nr:DUF1801 domain-containing protein [Hyphomicrobiales bacterium]